MSADDHFALAGNVLAFPDAVSALQYMAEPFTIAQVLCECDGKVWAELSPWDIDRYLRIGVLVVMKLGEK